MGGAERIQRSRTRIRLRAACRTRRAGELSPRSQILAPGQVAAAQDVGSTNSMRSIWCSM
jgi:hypothetical protein